MSALLYLPALPVDPYHSDEETGHPALQTIRVDRAYADDPTPGKLGTFEWDADCRVRLGLDSVQPAYDDNYADPSILYCRSATRPRPSTIATSTSARPRCPRDGVQTTIEFEPAVRIPEEWLPNPSTGRPVEPKTLQPENPKNREGAADRREPPDVNGGDSGGTAERGPGESERNEATRTAEERRLPRRRQPCLNASILPLPRNEEPAGTQDGDGTQENAPDEQAGRAGESDAASKESMPGKAFADSSTSRDSAATSAGSTSSGTAHRMPGFALAIGGTIGAMALISGIAAFARARRKR